MNKKIQDKIDYITAMADRQPKLSSAKKIEENSRPYNSLSHSIRNKKEAEQFQAELKVVIDLAQNK